MKYTICLAALVLALTVSAQAAEVPRELERAAPEAAEDLADGDLSGGTGFAEGVGDILSRLADQAGAVVRERTKGAAALLLLLNRAVKIRLNARPETRHMNHLSGGWKGLKAMAMPEFSLLRRQNSTKLSASSTMVSTTGYRSAPMPPGRCAASCPMTGKDRLCWS